MFFKSKHACAHMQRISKLVEQEECEPRLRLLVSEYPEVILTSLSLLLNHASVSRSAKCWDKEPGIGLGTSQVLSTC